MLLLVMLHAVFTIAWLSAASMALMFLHLMIMMSRSRVIRQKGVRRSLLVGTGRPICLRQNRHLHNTNFLEVKKRQDGRMLRPSCRFFTSKRRNVHLNFCATEGISSTWALVSLWSPLFCSVEVC